MDCGFSGGTNNPKPTFVATRTYSHPVVDRIRIFERTQIYSLRYRIYILFTSAWIYLPHSSPKPTSSYQPRTCHYTGLKPHITPSRRTWGYQGGTSKGPQEARCKGSWLHEHRHHTNAPQRYRTNQCPSDIIPTSAPQQ